ncbi:MAG: 3-dehydroquinate synthase [Paenibacillaceae bacterium]|nr:3-dehydroquinate synthase [Paenibacillaceae bacterium]
MHTLTVHSASGAYDVLVGDGVVAHLAEQLRAIAGGHVWRAVMITDEHVYARHGNRVFGEMGDTDARICTIPAGERSKNMHTVYDLITQMLEARCDRHTIVVAFGGGVVGDVAGFVAATYMRGIPYVHVPTTILAHDSSVGGKVGINHPLAKNVIGAFYPPRAVVYDTSFLHTLPDREVRSGLAEVIKHGLIADASFVEWCIAHMDALRACHREHMAKALHRGMAIKAGIVSADEREQGNRAVLNLGHTIGHALEAVSQYVRWTHGEAISIGMCGSARIAHAMGLCAWDVVTRTEEVLRAAHLPTTLPVDVATNDVIEAMQRDKKFHNGNAVFVLPVRIGSVTIVRNVPMHIVVRCLHELQGGQTA